MAAHALTQHQDNDAALSLPFYIEPTILSSWTGDWSERSVLFHMTTHPQHNDPNKPFYSLSLFKMFSCWNNKSVFQGSFEQRHKNVCFQAATDVSVRKTYEWGRVGWPQQSRCKVKKSLMTMMTMKKYSPSTWLVLGLCRVMLMAGMLWLESGTWPWPPFSTWPRPPPPGRYDLTISSSLSSPVSGPSSEKSFHKYFEITQSIVRRKGCQKIFSKVGFC